MRVRLVIVGLLLPLGVLVSSCSSSGATTTDPDGGSTPGSNPDGGAGGGDARPDAPPNDCKLGELAGVADITPTFVTHEPPATAPPAMTGGTLNGSYKVDKAKVFLPTMTKGLADPTKSTGTVNAWAIFNGKNYRLFLKSTFSFLLNPELRLGRCQNTAEPQCSDVRGETRFIVDIDGDA